MSTPVAQTSHYMNNVNDNTPKRLLQVHPNIIDNTKDKNGHSRVIFYNFLRFSQLPTYFY